MHKRNVQFHFAFTYLVYCVAHSVFGMFLANLYKIFFAWPFIYEHETEWVSKRKIAICHLVWMCWYAVRFGWYVCMTCVWDVNDVHGVKECESTGLYCSGRMCVVTMAKESRTSKGVRTTAEGISVANGLTIVNRIPPLDLLPHLT